ncbi:Hypothetical protein PHPALM_8657 [Phytophthora palmivora]|uniref:Uncharacterized protein n=1 Tax=Phytophthora palmivora TaxID=4796 RepID=A0A2P4Y9A7_9STRA|nr:Hypothetical protein PHPALM_8657 [Phytophthora palmivora]
MSSELLFSDQEETHELLQDILDFIDENISTSAAPSNDPCPKKRSRVYSPDYERSRREKKKAEREALHSQIERYEAQLELLRLQKPIQKTESKWGWVHVATEEEEKRRQAEELNYQLKGLLIQQLHGAQILGSMVLQQAEISQGVLTHFSPRTTAIPLDTFINIGVIAKHLKETLHRLRISADSMFSLSTLEGEDGGALMSSANVKYDDSIADSCIELRSSTPLSCSYESAVTLLWKMLLDKKVLGLHAGCYTMETKKLSQHSAEFGYSINNETGDLGNLRGVTIFEKTQDESGTTLLWASMSVQQNGKPFSRCQGCLSVSRLSRNPHAHGSVVRSSSRLCGKSFGLARDNNHKSIPIPGKDLAASKARLERAQLRIMEHAELQDV